jgi:serine O-acetyltransferase
MPDPVAHAINCMLDHIHAMDQQMENMCKSLKTLGMELEEVDLPDLGVCEISNSRDLKGPDEIDAPAADNQKPVRPKKT